MEGDENRTLEGLLNWGTYSYSNGIVESLLYSGIAYLISVTYWNGFPSCYWGWFIEMSILHGEFLWVYAKKNRNSMTITIMILGWLALFGIDTLYWDILGKIREYHYLKGSIYQPVCAVRTSCTSWLMLIGYGDDWPIVSSHEVTYEKLKDQTHPNVKPSRT